ncbi:Hypothetical predicted protein [Mytilus galloprovincialis]|uniref:PiggyBac transposable element-derived protein domain-containing protein n=1 Tax=Mytilus galloprovincialis TaxID=29158 RepID=A0A8B6HR17_MYTGA|nr:Hypothetical predicted protein [Mytilus galloprovincialis]
MDDGDSGSEYESDIHILDSESEGDEELDEGIPMNRGPWFPVLDPWTFSLPEPNFHEQTGPGYQVVTELMRPHFNKEHHVTVDSFFTSPKLVHDLKDKGTFCTGTVIKTRRGMPKSYRTAKLQKGDMTVKYQGQLMAVLWAVRRLVTILTTTGSAR